MRALLRELQALVVERSASNELVDGFQAVDFSSVRMSGDPRARFCRTASASCEMAVRKLASFGAMAFSGTVSLRSRSCSVASMRMALPNRENCPHSTRRAFVKSATRASSAGVSVAFAAIGDPAAPDAADPTARSERATTGPARAEHLAQARSERVERRVARGVPERQDRQRDAGPARRRGAPAARTTGRATPNRRRRARPPRPRAATHRDPGARSHGVRGRESPARWRCSRDRLRAVDVSARAQIAQQLADVW